MMKKMVELVDVPSHDSSETEYGKSRKPAKSVATRVIDANKATTFKSVMFIFAALMLTTISSLAIILTRPTKIIGGTLTDSENKAVGVATSTRAQAFQDIIMLADPSDALDNLKSFRLTVGGGMMMFKVAGYSMFENNIEIATLTGHVVVVDKSFTPFKIDVFSPPDCNGNKNLTSGATPGRRLLGKRNVGKVVNGLFRVLTYVFSYSSGQRVGPDETNGTATLDNTVIDTNNSDENPNGRS